MKPNVTWASREAVKKDLADYREGTLETGLLLIGSRGLSMRQDADQMAAFLLGIPTDGLRTHPDYREISLGEEEKTIGVEAVHEILEFASLRPVIADRRIVLVDQMDKMTVPAQNKLLKLIEEETGHILMIGVAYEDTILATIKSRMRVIRYSPADRETYLAAGGSLEEYFITGGCPEGQSDQEVLSVFHAVSDVVEQGRERDLFRILHLLKEKDPASFFATHRERIGALIALLGTLYTRQVADYPNMEIEDIIDLCGRNREKCDALCYTKESFFGFVAELIERRTGNESI